MQYCCPICSSMLVVEEMKQGKKFSCRVCPYFYPSKGRTPNKYPDLKPIEGVLKKTSSWNKENEVNKHCPKCCHQRAFSMQHQVKKVDEPKTTFYRCVRCDHIWSR